MVDGGYGFPAERAQPLHERIDVLRRHDYAARRMGDRLRRPSGAIVVHHRISDRDDEGRIGRRAGVRFHSNIVAPGLRRGEAAFEDAGFEGRPQPQEPLPSPLVNHSRADRWNRKTGPILCDVGSPDRGAQSDDESQVSRLQDEA